MNNYSDKSSAHVSDAISSNQEGNKTKIVGVENSLDPKHYRVSDVIDQSSTGQKISASSNSTPNPTIPTGQVNPTSQASPNSSSPEQTAAYLADMLQELQGMAQKSGHSSLGEMLEFAHREAVWRSRVNVHAQSDQEEIR